MNIQEFIRESLCQIVAGTQKAKEKHSDVVLPNYEIHYDTKTPSGTVVDTGGQLLFLVEFDLAVTVTEESETSGKAGLSIQIVSAGGQKTASTSMTSVTRIKFSVPISWAQQNPRPN